MRSNPPPQKIAKSAFMGTLFEQPTQAQIRPKSKYFCAHQIANDKTIILSTENVQKVHPRPKLWGFEKISENLLTVPIFELLLRAQIGPKCKNFCDHRKANDQTIILSSENVQKVHCRPELWGFEKSCCEIVH